MSDTSADARRGDTFGFIRRNIRQYGILFALIIIMVFFQVVTGGILFKPVNLTNLFLQNSHIVILAVGMLLVIVAGHIDLSVGSVAAFVGALAGIMSVKMGLPTPVVVVLSLAAGAVIGGIVEIKEGMAGHRGRLRGGRHHCVCSASSRALNQSPLARTQ